MRARLLRTKLFVVEDSKRMWDVVKALEGRSA